jgi:LDH2 family malate/lactate/ureidoglycolate dehydrogenase
MERRVAVEELRRFCVEALVKAGLQIDDAGIVADVLVMTDTWGTFSHGTGALRNYLNAMRAGGIDSHGKAEVVTEGDSWAVIDGHSGMGMLGCCLAMNTAIEKASTRSHGQECEIVVTSELRGTTRIWLYATTCSVLR